MGTATKMKTPETQTNDEKQRGTSDGTMNVADRCFDVDKDRRNLGTM